MKTFDINGVGYEVIAEDRTFKRLAIETASGKHDFWFDTTTNKKVARVGRGYRPARGSVPGQNRRHGFSASVGEEEPHEDVKHGRTKSKRSVSAVPLNPILEAVRHITLGEVFEWFEAYGDAKSKKAKDSRKTEFSMLPDGLQKMFAEHFGVKQTALERAVKKAYHATHASDPTGEIAQIQAYSLLGISLGMTGEYISGLIEADRPSARATTVPAPEAAAPTN